MSMIEKVARALAAARELDALSTGDFVHATYEEAAEGWAVFARADIEAMEPTEAMARAMKPRPAHWPPRGADAAMDASIDADRLAAKQMFTDAIQAALEG